MLKNACNSLFKTNNSPWLNLGSLFHTSKIFSGLEKWKWNNCKMYPPQSPDEPPRPAFVVHCKEDIKYSYQKLWYIACLIRGMSIDEALKQLQFVSKKGAIPIRETILEAQKMAVEEHNVEFKSNLWISESFVGKGMMVKGARHHARRRICCIQYRYTHYFVTLEEGTPPKHYYYHKRPKTGEELLSEWLHKMRNRKIITSL